MRAEHDVVVIGGGHNGLTAACKLARSGLDVHVVEASPTFGGQSTTLPLVKEAPQHRISPYAVDDIFLTASGLVDELQLRRFGYTDVFIDPSYVYLHPDGATLAFWQDARRTAEEIRAFSLEGPGPPAGLRGASSTRTPRSEAESPMRTQVAGATVLCTTSSDSGRSAGSAAAQTSSTPASSPTHTARRSDAPARSATDPASAAPAATRGCA